MKLVLVCEHSIFVRHAMVSMLRELGLRPLLASDGREGYAMAKFFQPDLVISEINLPDTSGVELLQRVTNDVTLRPIPWIMMGLPGEQTDYVASVCPQFLPKPVKSRALEQMVYQALHLEANSYVGS
jgi:CheY-like chemotaxis protein